MTSSSAADESPGAEDTGLTPDELEQVTQAEHEVAPVSYSGTDFDVEGLVRRLNRGDIVIPSFGHGDSTLELAGFQRDFVWRRPQMDRFIESLLLGYPIPGIMLVEQLDKRYLVLDGQQRLRTLRAFYEGVHQGREFILQNVADDFKNLTYKILPPEQRRLLDNTFIQATIVKTDGTEPSLEAVYQVFERLNSGGTQLTPHEIRIALYPGKMVELLAELNQLDVWRSLYGAKSPRLRDQELLLRILSLYFAPTYYRPLKKFLNDFLGKYRELKDFPTEQVVRLFRSAAILIHEGPGRKALRYQSPQVNAALTEALFVGLMRRLNTGTAPPTPGQVNSAITTMQRNPDLTSVISGSTATEEYVRTRLSLATEAFAAA